jgi:hypothetical protein
VTNVLLSVGEAVQSRHQADWPGSFLEIERQYCTVEPPNICVYQIALCMLLTFEMENSTWVGHYSGTYTASWSGRLNKISL